jgi:hypothetical protein
MRTVFAKILLWSFGTLVLSLGAYLFISTGPGYRGFPAREGRSKGPWRSRWTRPR